MSSTAYWPCGAVRERTPRPLTAADVAAALRGLVDAQKPFRARIIAEGKR